MTLQVIDFSFWYYNHLSSPLIGQILVDFVDLYHVSHVTIGQVPIIIN